MSDFSPRTFLIAGALLVAVAGMTGCSDGYSNKVVFEVRTDPIFVSVSPIEFQNPDAPGQLPINRPADMQQEGNPYNVEGSQKDLKIVDPSKISPQIRMELKQALDSHFGTPSGPYVELSNNDSIIEKLKLDDRTLALGSKLYRIQCLQCHGVTGNGRGPTAEWVNPHPRDYRQGLFKFASVNGADGKLRKPLRSDLYQVLYTGVEGTSMPAFNLMKEEELDALVSYVIHLSIRGEAEVAVMKNMKEIEGELVWPTDAAETLEEALSAEAAFIAQQWVESQDQGITPSAYPYDEADEKALSASVRRGQALFLGKGELLKDVLSKEDLERLYPKSESIHASLYSEQGKDVPYEESLNKLAARANCASCHIKYGAQGLWKFDSWGTMVKPRNLNYGVYRGGRRPVDIYYRIHSGIKGSGMIAYGGSLNGEQIWDLVNFIQTLPQEVQRSQNGEKLRYLEKLYPIGS